MANLLNTSISGSNSATGSLKVSGSQPVQLPLLSGANVTADTPYKFFFDTDDNTVKYTLNGTFSDGAWSTGGSMNIASRDYGAFGTQNATVTAGGFAP